MDKKTFSPKTKISWRNVGKTLLFYLALGLVAVFVFSKFFTPTEILPQVKLSQVLDDAGEQKITKIEVKGNLLTLFYKDGQRFQSRKESTDSLISIFQRAGIDPTLIEIEVKDDETSNFWSNLRDDLLPIALTLLFLSLLLRQSQKAAGSLFSFGKARARLFSKSQPKVTFDDADGVDEAKQELSEVVDFLKNPEKYKKLGARIPKGVLLVGPAGTGKTLLARAVANEANVPFFSMAGSEFMEMLVGVGPSVTGDTPILVRNGSFTKLIPIADFVDQYYKEGKEGFPVSVQSVQTLGFEKEKTGFWGSTSKNHSVFGRSVWKDVKAVYRHKADEIYEIHYLGGMLKTTGGHSIFVRRQGGVTPIAAKDLKVGDILVDLPLNIRREFSSVFGTRHKIKAHRFPKEVDLELDFWNEDQDLRANYEFALANQNRLTQYEVANLIGVSQATVGHWQNKVHMPQALSRKLVKLNLPEKVSVTPALMKLFGYYTAEGRCGSNLEFVFGAHEHEFHRDCTNLIREIFGLGPVLEATDTNTLRIKYYSRHLGRFFARHCGNGSHKKHVPEFIWDLPREYFLAFLEGYANGDGEITKGGKLRTSSVSQQLVRELAWLCCMHGIGVGIEEEYQKGGRVIKNNPLPPTRSWRLIIGKTSNPFFNSEVERPFQIKRAIVKKIVKKPYKDYVYDLCGCENEAFFGGEKPVLLHNSRVRDLFLTAKNSAPAIIFIDELESIGHYRGASIISTQGEQEQTLNQILTEMDGFTPTDRVVVLAATNRPDLLDPALTRPGRFDRRIVLELPDIEGRKGILRIHMKGKPFTREVDVESLARRTVGFSGADIENMLNEAAILAARLGKSHIDNSILEEAATKVKLGPERKRLQSEEEKQMTAFHEAGHAVVAVNLPRMDPVHRVSIVARGLSLGFTMIPPKIDRYNQTKTRLLETVTALLGGRAAEELKFSEMTVGAGSDLEKATRTAHEMVTKFGMSDLGPLSFEFYEFDESWPSRFLREKADYSEKMAAKIDSEVKKIIDECYKRAKKILRKNWEKLEKVAEELIKKETLEQEEFERLVR